MNVQDDSTASEASPFEADPFSVGATLRTARERTGKDVAMVASQLRIRQPFLQALEDGRHKDLPGGTYAIGFLRTYAEFLSLDGEEMVRRFKQEAAGDLHARSELVFPSPVSEGRIPNGGILFVGLVLAAAAYGAWYWLSARDGHVAEMVPPLPERLTSVFSRPASLTTEKAQPKADEAAKPEDAPKADEAAKPEEGTPSAESAPSPTDGEQAKAAAGHEEMVPPGEGEDETAADKAKEASPPAASAEGDKVKDGKADKAAKAAKSAEAAKAAKADAKPADAAKSAEAAKTAKADAKPAEAAKPVEATKTPEPAKTPEAAKPAEQAKPAEAAKAPEAAKVEAPKPSETAAEAVKAETAPDAAAGQAGTVYGTEHTDSRVVIKAASEDCWVQVREMDGALLLSRLLHKGESYRVPNRPGLTLTVGNAGALEVAVDGRVLPKLGQSGQVRHDVSLDPAKLAP